MRHGGRGGGAQERLDGRVGEGRELGGGTEPAREVRFEAELVGVAEVEGLARGLEHDAVLEEGGGGGGEEGGCARVPGFGAACLRVGQGCPVCGIRRGEWKGCRRWWNGREERYMKGEIRRHT